MTVFRAMKQPITIVFLEKEKLESVLPIANSLGNILPCLLTGSCIMINFVYTFMDFPLFLSDIIPYRDI